MTIAVITPQSKLKRKRTMKNTPSEQFCANEREHMNKFLQESETHEQTFERKRVRTNNNIKATLETGHKIELSTDPKKSAEACDITLACTSVIRWLLFVSDMQTFK